MSRNVNQELSLCLSLQMPVDQPQLFHFYVLLLPSSNRTLHGIHDGICFYFSKIHNNTFRSFCEKRETLNFFKMQTWSKHVWLLNCCCRGPLNPSLLHRNPSCRLGRVAVDIPAGFCCSYLRMREREWRSEREREREGERELQYYVETPALCCLTSLCVVYVHI